MKNSLYINMNKYHNNVYEIFGYVTKDDTLYFTLRNSVEITEEQGGNLATTCFGTGVYPKDYIIISVVCNIMIIAGYIPVIGILPAIFKIKYPRDKNKYIREVFEILGLGLLFMPIDIWVTIKRRYNPPILHDLLKRGKLITYSRSK